MLFVFYEPSKNKFAICSIYWFFYRSPPKCFFGLHATLFTLTVLLINYNYFRLRMFSTFQTTITFSFFTAFFVGFKSILLTTMNFQYLLVFLSFFSAFVSYLIIPSLGKLLINKIKL